MDSPLQFDPSSVRPVAILGLAGFDADEIGQLRSQLKAATLGGVHWKIGAFAGADAWLASGSRARLLANDEVVVDGAAQGEAAVHLWLPKVDRPIAFSRPIRAERFEPQVTFDLSGASLQVVLAKFARWLRPKSMLFYLADVLAEHARALQQNRVHHVMAGPRLVGVVDLRGETGVLPDATLDDLANATWVPRPDSASYIPDNFARRNTRELLWEYASRTQRDLLPEDYRYVPIYLRKAPQVADRMFSDAQLFVLRELEQGPRTFLQLCEGGSFRAPEIERALAAMIIVGSLTRSPERALGAPATDAGQSGWPGSVPTTDSKPTSDDLTAVLPRRRAPPR